MCGVNLIVGGRDPGRDVARMNAATNHRGPDSDGVYVTGPSAIGSVRLAIRDVSHGHQPMVDPAAGVAVAFNGEVWNDRELRGELTALGRSFHTDCDTEVVLQGYCEWGDGLFDRLDADFAIAAIDGRRERAILARDRLGVKPLYFATVGSRLIASSEIKGILAVCPPGTLRHRPFEVAAHADLFRDSERTEVEGVSAVLPGQFLDVACHGGKAVATTQAYFQRDSRPRDTDLETATATVARLLDEAVRRQVVSERPVAVALSGGVDSSVIAGLASQHIDVMCYCLGTADVAETENARAVADDLRSRGHRILGFKEVRVDEAAIRRHVDAALCHLESAYPIQADMAVVTYLLAKQVARDGYRVLLSGEGADEVFLGYHSYFQRRRREGALTAAMTEQLDNLHRYNNARLDKSCMAHGVEARVPFQYGPLVAYAAGINPDQKIGNPTPADGRPDVQKFVLRRAVERLVGLDGQPLLAPDVVWRYKQYYAQGMALPDMIGRALGLPTAGLDVAAAARVRQREYEGRLRNVLFPARAERFAA